MPLQTADATWELISQRGVMAASIVYALALAGYVAEWALSRRVTPQSAGATDVVPHADPVAAVTAPQGTSPHTHAAPHPHGLPPEAPTWRAPVEAGFTREFAGRAGVTLTAVAALLHLVALVSRGLAAQRVPWGNMYEFALAGSFGAVLLYLVLSSRGGVRWLGLPVCLLVLTALMTASLTLYVPAGPLVPALQSYWLVIHVVAAVIATGAFTVGAVTSALYLLQTSRRGRRTTSSGRPRHKYLPDADTIDQVAYRVHAFAFPVWTFAALIAGPIWAKYAWGRYWGWDPKEVWAFVTWVVYAAYLHSRATGGWRGRRAAVVALVGFATVLFNFVGINMFGSGLHSYSGL